MSCNSAIYTVNSSGTAIAPAAGQFAQIPFGSVRRRFGRCLQLDGGSILACGSGYFDCSVNANLVPTAAGEITLQLLQDGVTVAEKTVTAAAAGDYVQVCLDPLVRNCGSGCSSTLSIGVNAACTVVDVSAKVEKI